MLSKISSQIQNGFLSKKSIITLKQYNKIILNFLNILTKEGFIFGYKFLKINNKNIILVYLKINKNKNILNKIILFSTKYKKRYIKFKQLNKLKNTFNLYICSTSKGLLSHKETLKYNLGGELLFKII